MNIKTIAFLHLSNILKANVRSILVLLLCLDCFKLKANASEFLPQDPIKLSRGFDKGKADQFIETSKSILKSTGITVQSPVKGITVLNNKYEEIKLNNKELELELENKSNTLIQLKLSNTNLSNQVIELQSNNTQLARQSSQHVKEISDHQNITRVLKEQLITHQMESTQNKILVSKLYSKIDEITLQHKQADKKNQEEGEKLKTELKDKLKTITQLEVFRTNLSNQVTELQSNNTGLLIEISKYKKEMVDNLSTIKTLQTDKLAFTKEVSDNQDAIKVLEKKLIAHQIESNQNKVLVSKLYGKINEITFECDQADKNKNGEIEKLKTDLEDKLKRITQLEISRTNLSDQITELQSNNAKLLIQISQYKEEIADSQSTIKTLQTDILLHEEALTQDKTVTLNLRKSIDEITSKFDQIDKDQKEKIHQLTEKLLKEKLRIELEDKSESLVQSKTLHANLSNQVTELQSKNTRSLLQISQHEKETNDNKNIIMALQKEIHDLHDKEFNSEIIVRTLTDEKVTLCNQNKQLILQITNLESHTQAYREDIERLNSDLSNNQILLNDSKQEVLENKNEKDLIEQTNAITVCDLKNQQDYLMAENYALNEENKKLERSIILKEKEHNTLKLELFNLNNFQKQKSTYNYDQFEARHYQYQEQIKQQLEELQAIKPLLEKLIKENQLKSLKKDIESQEISKIKQSSVEKDEKIIKLQELFIIFFCANIQTKAQLDALNVQLDTLKQQYINDKAYTSVLFNTLTTTLLNNYNQSLDYSVLQKECRKWQRRFNKSNNEHKRLRAQNMNAVNSESISSKDSRNFSIYTKYCPIL